VTTVELLRTAWDWEPSVVAGCGALAAGYLCLMLRTLPDSVPDCFGAATVRERSSSMKPLLFLTGVLLLLVDLVSPLDALGDNYLFSAHVLQHFLLTLVIPPLLVLGTPRELAIAALRRRLMGRVERGLARPRIAWPLGVGTMLAWHIPVFFNAALAHDALHIVQHLSFLITGTIFWWPILHPLEERRPGPLIGIAYLFSACTACSLLGAALTFGPLGLYPAYLNPEDRFGILRLVRDGWGLDPRNDQQLGGMLMWVPGCFVYLSGTLATAVRWYGAPQPLTAGHHPRSKVVANWPRLPKARPAVSGEEARP